MAPIHFNRKSANVSLVGNRDRRTDFVPWCLLLVFLPLGTLFGSTVTNEDSRLRIRVAPGAQSFSGAEDIIEGSYDPDPNDKLDDYDMLGDDDPAERNSEWLIAPIPSYNPTLGWTVALPVSLIYRPPSVSSDDPAWMTGMGGFYAENKSWGGGGFHKMNLDDDKWRMMFAAIYADLNYDFYGIGENTQSRQSIGLNQNTINIIAEVLREVLPDFYVGLRIMTMDTEVFLTRLPDFIPPEVIPPGISNTLRLNDVAPRVVYDTRDTQFYPTSGSFIEAQFQISAESLGSDLSYERFEFEWNNYRPFGNQGVLALRTAVKYVGGDAPFFLYPAFGQNSDLRGYTPGVYRDRLLVATQAEYRRQISQKIGVVAFAGVGGVGPSIDSLSRALPSVGVGIRYLLAEENKISFRVDAAWGRDEEQIYVGIGEAF